MTVSVFRLHVYAYVVDMFVFRFNVYAYVDMFMLRILANRCWRSSISSSKFKVLFCQSDQRTNIARQDKII